MVLLFWVCCLSAQTGFLIQFQPVFFGENIALEQPIRAPDGDSISLHTLRFYLSNVIFLKKGVVVFAEKNSHHLLDVEYEKSLLLPFDFPQKLDFDSLQFELGVDSTTTVSGAMGDDLDPTHGMFWVWQSGYINFKIEGFSRKSSARQGTFQFHLGGYLPPFQTLQTVRLPVFSNEKAVLQLDLTPFFEKIDWAKNSGIMSPCREAVDFSKILAKSFSIHAD